jgi:hypothetical protein
MRGRKHQLKIISFRQQSGVNAGKPIRDTEGRVNQSPTNPPADVLSRDVEGFIGFPGRQEVADGGEAIDNAAHLPLGTVVHRGDEIEAVTGDAMLDGRYQVTGVQVGRVMVRALLRRRVT